MTVVGSGQGGGLAGMTGLAYDNAGNLTAANGMTLAYDAWGHLSSVTNTPYGTVSFAYDTLGRRVSKTVGATTTYSTTAPATRALRSIPTELCCHAGRILPGAVLMAACCLILRGHGTIGGASTETGRPAFQDGIGGAGGARKRSGGRAPAFVPKRKPKTKAAATSHAKEPRTV